MKNGTIRPATKNDAQVIVELIRQLADYEKLSHEAVMTAELIEKNVFENKYAHVLLVQENEAIIGFALYFFNFSTFLGKPGLYLEDLFIKPEYRGRGYGKALLKHLAKICDEKGYGRLQWWVLDWNSPAIEFYKSLGAEAMDEWTVYRTSGQALKDLGD